MKHGAADHLVGGVAEDLLRRAVPAGDDPVQGLADDRVARRVDDRGEAGRAGVQPRLGFDSRVERDLRLLRGLRGLRGELLGLERLLFRDRHGFLRLGGRRFGDAAEAGVVLRLCYRQPALPVHESAQRGDPARDHEHLRHAGNPRRARQEVREQEIACGAQDRREHAGAPAAVDRRDRDPQAEDRRRRRGDRRLDQFRGEDDHDRSDDRHQVAQSGRRWLALGRL